ncbi:MAG TPA: AraC family transcriptional regulator [Casimicrobiaceae bacterium]|nr:AraC family transcriptional regulator [Casimicrobiaceae bacterium]
MDALSDVLKSVRLEGALYLNAEFTAPWCLRGRYGRTSVRERLAGAEHVVFFHFVTEGRCKVRLADSTEVVDVEAGDVVLFPRDDRHLLGSDLHLAPLDSENLDERSSPAPDVIQVRHGGGGAVTRFVCSYLACSRSLVRPLLEALPRLVRIPIGDVQSDFIHSLLQEGVRESWTSRAGSESMRAKVAELLFTEALRRYMEGLPPGGNGWLASMRDPQVGRALALLHGDPGKAWTVDALANGVALSRSALAERFTTLVGESPIRYLQRWRLALAAQALRSSRDAVARIAERSGYESETAFSRAFRREFGVAPAGWRKP